jgi:hypothetical protein
MLEPIDFLLSSVLDGGDGKVVHRPGKGLG